MLGSDSVHSVLMSLLIMLVCGGTGFLARLLFTEVRLLHEMHAVLRGIARELQTLHTSIDGRFNILHEQLLQAHAANLTLRERLAVAEERDLVQQRQQAVSAPPPPSPPESAP